MHWTYEQLERDQLHQGDVLRRTAEFDALLGDVHPYFREKSNNAYFMVLTQTCDLVRRPIPKTEYIAICPVRPLENIVSRSMRRYVVNSNSNVPIGTTKDQQKFREFLSRLFNNNESGLFYLDASSNDLEFDCCAITRLSISIKANEHYDKCLRAKIVQLSEPFRAKLGWSVGNIYSRVGTQDWDNTTLQDKIKNTLYSSIVWVPDERHKKELIERLDQIYAAGQVLDENVIQRLRKSLPSSKAKLVDLVGQLIIDAGVDEHIKSKIIKRLASDPALKGLVRA